MKVRITAAARADLHGIFKTVAENNVAAARRLRTNLGRVIETLATQPERGRAMDLVAAMPLRRLVMSPYLIFYVCRDSTVTIIRILHGARDIDSALEEEPGWPDKP